MFVSNRGEVEQIIHCKSPIMSGVVWHAASFLPFNRRTYQASKFVIEHGNGVSHSIGLVGLLGRA